MFLIENITQKKKNFKWIQVVSKWNRRGLLKVL